MSSFSTPAPQSKLLNGRFWRNFLPLPATSQLALGDRAPDFTLTEVATRQPYQLSQHWGERPVVLAFTRIFTERHYCPLCFPHLVALNDATEKFTAAGAQLVLITSTDLAQSQIVRTELNLQAPLLSDPFCQAFNQYGTGQALGAPLSAQFVLDKYGRIRFWHYFSFLAYNAEPAKLLYALATLPNR
ncbi:redoxin domain-containing protein [Oscillatoria sp. CS-180]|uniref:redoxin domain-containing protein n=1 Tax=Oscillatoria sp. CS-180 TaxID=3021720 RepID=UPI002330EA02|nr:redoxin domain-containing protein [Oscillatoria sp. CS-180]MDB9526008.1 redoxin domain-containing protein [Oscillatoria sp. CS-180]